jgi:hypothetical protein
METKHKITIPKPCHEDWNKMTPNETGRFCNSCSKSVVDFTQMLPDEIQDFFIKNKGQKICGRFHNKQLDSIVIQIPNQVLFSQIHYHKMFLLALFIAMGTTLFSCKQENGDKQKIEKVEVVKDTSEIEMISVGDVPVTKNGATHLPPPPPPKIDQIKFVTPPSKSGKVKFHKPLKISCGETITRDSIVEEDTIVMGAVIELKPDYPGGINNFYNFFIEKFTQPEEIEKPKKPIIVSFIIEKDGSLSSFNFPKDTNPQIGTEIIPSYI